METHKIIRSPNNQGKAPYVTPAAAEDCRSSVVGVATLLRDETDETDNDGSLSHMNNKLPTRQRPLPVNIVIPMAGRGSRFANVGFIHPKPIIDVGGRPMISWVLDNVDSKLIEATFIMLVLREHEQRYGLVEKLRPLKPRMRFVLVDEVTDGAACTVLLAREHINSTSPMLVVNSDQFVEWSADGFWGQMIEESQRSIDGSLLCFHIAKEEEDTRWSYAKVDPATGFVTEVQEKKVISTNATVGFYYWREGCDFVASAEAMVAENARINNEFYIAPVYNYGVRQFGRCYTTSFCQTMWGLGVPEDLVRFLSGYVRPRRADVDQSGPIQARASGPLRFIAHRGNVEGADPQQENRPEYIKRALSLGFDVEVDVWRDNANDGWHLGHDGPQYAVDYDFLLTPRLWLHCKNGFALQLLSRDPRVQCFFHDHDDYTMTSKGVAWIYPGKPLLGRNSIAVMFRAPAQLLSQDIYGLCQDDVGPLRRQYVTMQARPVPMPTIKLVVFDLDGVLVESRDLHYKALNQAIEKVAGSEYIIERHEHLTVYDGLSTNQKLAMLMVQKSLPVIHHEAIWRCKQDLTAALVRQVLNPTAHITQALVALKKRGYPVAVASNCIRSSVVSILETIGLLHHIDVLFSNEDVSAAKPAPDIYLRTCRAFCVEPSETLVVEDSHKGFEAALLAGCQLLQVRSPDDVRETRIFRRIAEIQSPVRPITVVIPLAGVATDFWLNGHAGSVSEVPLFLADAGGRPVIECIINALRSDRFPMHFVFLIKEAHAKAFKLESLCLNAVGYEPSAVVTVQGDTLGAIKTVLSCPRRLIDPHAPLLIVDGNHVLKWGPGRSIDDLLSCHADGAMTVHSSSDPRWAYVRLVPESTSAVGEVLIRNEPVSTLACAGYYFYRLAESFFNAAEALVARKQRHRGSYFIAPTFNVMIEHGQSVEVVYVEQVWSLRTAAEVKDFALHYFPWVAETTMTKIYNGLVERHAVMVAADGLAMDQRLYDAPDNRRCLAAYALCNHRNFHATDLLTKLCQGFFDILGPEHCHYRPLTEEDPTPSTQVGLGSNTLDAVLHFTFMQLISFAMIDKVQVSAEYGEMVEAVLQRSLPSFQVIFSRVVLTRSNILLLGFPSVNVNAAREQIRHTCQKMGFPLFEPYKTDIVHLTLARFASPVTDAQLRSLQGLLARLPRSSQFGSLMVNQLHLSRASWKMQVGELDDPGKVIAWLKGA